MAPDQETMNELMKITPVSSKVMQELEENPNLEISAETGEVIDVARAQQEVSAELDQQEAAETPEPEAPAVDQVDKLHYTEDQPTEIDYAKDPRYLRIDNLPSKFVFYGFSQVFARPLDVDLWIALTQAVNRQNITEFIDVFDKTLSVSIRELAYHDFIWYMYWQKLNSFPKQPIQITWTSRYGNENQTRVTDVNVIVDELELDPGDYQQLVEQGFRFPTVRDYEILMSGLLTPEQTEKYRIAQYYQFNELQYPNDKARVENYVKDSIVLIGQRSIPELDEFPEVKRQLTFGIKSQVELTDEHYSLDDWKQHLRRGVELVRARPDADQQVAEFMLNTLAQIKLREEAGEETGKAVPETVTLEFSPWGFFPDLPE